MCHCIYQQCMYICICMCVYVCVYIYIYIHIYIYISQRWGSEKGGPTIKSLQSHV